MRSHAKSAQDDLRGALYSLRPSSQWPFVCARVVIGAQVCPRETSSDGGAGERGRHSEQAQLRQRRTNTIFGSVQLRRQRAV